MMCSILNMVLSVFIQKCIVLEVKKNVSDVNVVCLVFCNKSFFCRNGLLHTEKKFTLQKSQTTWAYQNDFHKLSTKHDIHFYHYICESI